jgi:uncharacterized protein YjbJ (UPF0337 family)
VSSVGFPSVVTRVFGYGASELSKKAVVRQKMKSSKRDQAEGALYKVGGRVLEVVGSLSGDRKKQIKGRLGRGKGTAKAGEGRLKGLFKK